MKNFKEIAERCLAGELSGRFVCRDGLHIPSFTLSRTDNPLYPYKLYRVGKLTINGHTPNKYSQNDIIQFIPYEEMKPEQIKIDIPEGKIPVMEQTEKGVVITWKEKELTYEDIREKLSNDRKYIGNFGYNTMSPNLDTQDFYRKIGVIHKLVNIRNYFGKPDENYKGWIIEPGGIHRTIWEFKHNFTFIVFAKREHAEQAIKILGDELKYLFEPW